MDTEQLKQEELDVHVSDGTFRLAFVGMSNAGKSYRSRVLQNEMDFFWYEVDAHIQNALGIVDMEDISAWLGYPTQETYRERQQQYLNAEEKCTHLKGLDTEEKNLVFDTTGSVIYLSDEAKQWLHAECLTVNIDVGDGSISEMVENYFANPKPVIWGNSFNQKESEDDDTALRRCYPELLKYRLEQYRTFAHLTIPLSEVYDKTGQETIEIIKKYL